MSGIQTTFQQEIQENQHWVFKYSVPLMSDRFLIILRIHNEVQIFRRTWFLFVPKNKLYVLEVALSESLSLVLGTTCLQAASWALLKLLLDGFNSPEEVCELDSSLDLQINTNGENLFLTCRILNEANNFLSSMIVGLKNMIIWCFIDSNFPIGSMSQAPYCTINHFLFYIPVKKSNSTLIWRGPFGMNIGFNKYFCLQMCGMVVLWRHDLLRRIKWKCHGTCDQLLEVEFIWEMIVWNKKVDYYFLLWHKGTESSRPLTRYLASGICVLF